MGSLADTGSLLVQGTEVVWTLKHSLSPSSSVPPVGMWAVMAGVVCGDAGHHQGLEPDLILICSDALMIYLLSSWNTFAQIPAVLRTENAIKNLFLSNGRNNEFHTRSSFPSFLAYLHFI